MADSITVRFLINLVYLYITTNGKNLFLDQKKDKKFNKQSSFLNTIRSRIVGLANHYIKSLYIGSNIYRIFI
jgi:hypothetical protein